jgi:hypothetical protein
VRSFQNHASPCFSAQLFVNQVASGTTVAKAFVLGISLCMEKGGANSADSPFEVQGDPLMTADQYLYGILAREMVDTGPTSAVRGVQTLLMPMQETRLIKIWRNR